MTMRHTTGLLAALAAAALAGCASTPGALGERSVTIERTAYGVPHITAPDAQSLAYGVAYAYAQDNLCMTADQLVTARAQRSRHFGPKTTGLLGRRYLPNEQIDLFIAAHMDDAALERAWRQTSAETQALARGYVAGYNRYLADHGAQLPEACRGKPWVQPMTLAEYRRMAEITAVQAGAAALADGLLGAQPPQPAAKAAQASTQPVDLADAAQAMHTLAQAAPRWQRTPLAERCAALRKAADLLQAELPRFCGLLVQEAHKTLPDAVAEVREAIDACRYYAQQAELTLAPRELPGPTGERNELRLRGRGVFVCIAPWNFPLAIFGAQVVAALVAGNTVAAKPAEQTPGVARAFVDLLLQAGVPADAVALLHGPGATVGAALVADARCAGVAFTGSTRTAKLIQRALAASDGPIVPLIAETGGLNALVVDSSALPEQVVDAAVASAFGSAGQRCSALRVLCVHSGIAERVLDMLAGAMQALRLGDPADYATDVGPVIDSAAHRHLSNHLKRLDVEAKLLTCTPLASNPLGQHIAPTVFEISQLSELQEEVFGPVLHVLRWGPGTAVPELDALVEQINALGYGLTLGIQTRIDSRALAIAEQARVGNVYVNRNMTGAVIGVQPFGGEGLSGTGPKAGGPHYLLRFCAEQTLTINTAAASGNADLLASC